MAPDNKTEQVVIHHLSSFQAGDMDAVMSDYTENAKLITPTAVLSGKKEIREFLSGLLVLLPAGKSEINLEKLTVDDDLAYIVWNAKAPAIEVPMASDTFVIKGGKIHKQTFIGDMQEPGKAV